MEIFDGNAPFARLVVLDGICSITASTESCSLVQGGNKAENQSHMLRSDQQTSLKVSSHGLNFTLIIAGFHALWTTVWWVMSS